MLDLNTSSPVAPSQESNGELIADIVKNHSMAHARRASTAPATLLKPQVHRSPNHYTTVEEYWRDKVTHLMTSIQETDITTYISLVTYFDREIQSTQYYSEIKSNDATQSLHLITAQQALRSLYTCLNNTTMSAESTIALCDTIR